MKSTVDHRIIQAVDESVSRQNGGRRIGKEKLLCYTGPTLSFLAQCATAQKLTNYTEVSRAIGINNPQWANAAFAPVNRVIQAVVKERLFGAGSIPDITSIVTQKGKASFGRGLMYDHEDLAKLSHAEQLARVQVLRDDVFRWPYWLQLLALLGLKPLDDLSLGEEELARFASQSYARGKSPEHQRMQECIRENPLAAAKLTGILRYSACEYLFWSLDRLDVIAKTDDEWVGFEVKPSRSPSDEIRKGIYQAIKYQALIKADLLERGIVRRARCVLVCGGSLPKELRSLSERFGIEVRENFTCVS